MLATWRYSAVAVIALLTTGAGARADAIIVSESSEVLHADLEFDTNAILVNECFCDRGSGHRFRILLPDELYERLGHAPQPFVERLQRFFAEDWGIRTDGGTPLSELLQVIRPSLGSQ